MARPLTGGKVQAREHEANERRTIRIFSSRPREPPAAMQGGVEYCRLRVRTRAISSDDGGVAARFLQVRLRARLLGWGIDRATRTGLRACNRNRHRALRGGTCEAPMRAFRQ